MSLNLGNPADFAKATLSNLSGLLNSLTGLNNETWDIEESAYGHAPAPLVVFHVFKSSQDYNGAVSSVQDTLSRRVVPFEFPYVDGQTTDDLGRHGETFDFDILLFGPHYYEAYIALIQEFNNPKPGTLVHPVRGRFTAKFKEATIIHKSEARQAVALRVKFVEHNFEISFQSAKPSTKSALAKAVGFIGAISKVITAVESNVAVFTSIKNQLSALIKSYGSGYQAALVAMNTTFNQGTSSDIPGLLPTNSPTNEAFPSAASPSDPFSGLTPQQIQAQQSPALASLQAIDRVTALRNQLTAAILLMESANSDDGALIFYDEIVTLKQSSLALQKVLELGLQSSTATIKSYRVPALMGLREVCFANGIAVDRAFELEQLNPDILSANYIEEGTLLQVPSS